MNDLFLSVSDHLPRLDKDDNVFTVHEELLFIIKCMWSRCRRDDIHVCFAYASPQRMPHM